MPAPHRVDPNPILPAPGDCVKIVTEAWSELQDAIGVGSERFWDIRTADGQFRVADHLRYTIDLAFEDVVAAEPIGMAGPADPDVPLYRLTDVVSRSGWRNLLAGFASRFSVARWSASRDELWALGAALEHRDRACFAVAVPPGVGLGPIMDVLHRETNRGRFV